MAGRGNADRASESKLSLLRPLRETRGAHPCPAGSLLDASVPTQLAAFDILASMASANNCWLTAAAPLVLRCPRALFEDQCAAPLNG